MALSCSKTEHFYIVFQNSTDAFILKIILIDQDLPIIIVTIFYSDASCVFLETIAWGLASLSRIVE
jgi:hypothetical protein